MPGATTEQAIETADVAATPEQCFAVASDLGAYAEWAQGVTSVTVDELDELGRPSVATFEAEAVGRSTRYTLGYDYSGAPNQLSWHLMKGDLMRRLDGSYHFDLSENQPGVTEITYSLTIDLAVPLPGFVKRRAEAKIVNAALRHFCRRVEAAN